MILVLAPAGWIFFGSGGASSLSILADLLLVAAWLKVESLTLRPVGCAGLPGSMVSLTWRLVWIIKPRATHDITNVISRRI